MSPLRPVLDRSRPTHPWVALGCGLVAVGLLLVLPVLAGAEPDLGAVDGPGELRWWAVAAVLVVQAVAVAWADRAPMLVLPGLTALPLMTVPLFSSAAFSLTAVAVLAAVFLAVVGHPLRRLRLPLLLAGLLLAVGQFVGVVGTTGAGAAALGAVSQALLVVGVPVVLASVVAARRDADEARRQELLALRREQDALFQAAMSRQRTALSRELHDIAAHHMSGIAMLAAAVERQIDTDPETARRSVRRIREQSRAVLGDLRRLVGLLREEADAARPVETLEAVTALVESLRAAGARIELLVPASLTEPGPLGQLVAYRTVQEALANAAAHAPGAPCVVEIAPLEDGRLAIVVRNGVPTGTDAGPGGGLGLVGMAERAQLVGAELAHGPTPDGGWEVRLTLPVGEAVGEAVGTVPSPTTPPEAPA